MSFMDMEAGLGPGPHGARYNNNIHAGGPDDDREYKALSSSISQQVFSITNNVASINKMVSHLGTIKDTPDLRAKLHNITETTRELVKNTSNGLKTLSHFEGNVGQSRQRKIEQQKLSKDFQKTLQEFQIVQRLSAEKQRAYVDKAKAHNVRNDVYTEEDETGIPAEEQPLIDDSQRRLQLQVIGNEVEYNEALIEEREEEIRGIEQGINELNEVFRDLATLVTEQQHMLDNIETNVSNITDNVRNAAEEVSIASRHQKGARNRMCFLLLIFAAVGGVVVLAALA
ncbi:7968_t:CDS:2 [Paraglomus brasilianum]|uniref:7968_t:CDS:1 n=1 Tax=Paraglomus brasilianum TaxID=144538 RepID=A0A9N9BWU7_9GLOM|nr:7968_t:CDS:2 [Paraglomus brasilianum]